jgi:hypothetical protein
VKFTGFKGESALKKELSIYRPTTSAIIDTNEAAF